MLHFDRNFPSADPIEAKSSTSLKFISKRTFLRSLGIFLGGLLGMKSSSLVSSAEESEEKADFQMPEISYGGKTPYSRTAPLAPPGVGSFARLARHCTACHLCIVQCPSHVLKPAGLEYGIRGLFQPTLNIAPGSFCNYDCTRCGEVCPTGAIQRLNKDQKHHIQIGRVAFIRENCVVVTDGTNCGACAEHCPTLAVHMIPYEGTLTIPDVDPDICVGCGACESICPVRPYRAIHVEGLAAQGEAKDPPIEEQVEKEVDDFGF